MKAARIALCLLLWVVFAAHVAIGMAVHLSPDTVTSIAEMYGVQVEPSSQLLYVVKPLGAFMIVMGLLAAVAAVRPARHRVFIYAIAVLFLLRSLQRFAYAGEIDEVFGIGSGRNMANAALFIGLAVLLVVLDLVSRGSRTSNGPAPAWTPPSSTAGCTEARAPGASTALHVLVNS